MNKETAIKKINKMGSIGRVISTIMIVILILGDIAAILGIAALAIIPDGLVTVKGSTELRMDVDPGVAGGNIDDSMVGNFMGGGHFSVGGFDFEMDKAQNDGTISYVVNPYTSNIDIKNFTSIVAATVGVITMALINCFFIRSLCNAFKSCSSPFEENIVKKLRNLAFSLIPWTVLGSLTSILSGAAISTFLMGSKQRFTVSIDLSMLLVVAIILMLSYIFKYGAVLQQESDETL